MKTKEEEIESDKRLAPLGTKRSDILICDKILDVSDEGANLTKILYGANLNYRQLKKYLDFLIQCGLLKKEDYTGVLAGVKKKDKGIKIIYSTTEKGKEFLTLVDKMRGLLLLENE